MLWRVPLRSVRRKQRVWTEGGSTRINEVGQLTFRFPSFSKTRKAIQRTTTKVILARQKAIEAQEAACASLGVLREVLCSVTPFRVPVNKLPLMHPLDDTSPKGLLISWSSMNATSQADRNHTSFQSASQKWKGYGSTWTSL